jgi:exopolyphosphatase / guanosine-5'-triphosphate,3'-diphosphate pyrophosphatase
VCDPPSGLAAYGCIDIGSNTTRLLVAEPGENGLRELMTQRVFTRIGKGLRKTKQLAPAKVEEVAEVVATQARHARELGAQQIVVVATAAIREARNGRDLVTAIQSQAGLPTKVLSDAEEARLAFLGASRSLGTAVNGTLAVVDVGGGSTEIAVGSMTDGVSWCESFRIGSGYLAESYLHSDPPSVEELENVRRHAAGAFEGLRTPPVDRAVAVGGSATSLRRMAGAELSHEPLERAIRVLASAPCDEIAERFELDPERVELLPAGVLILEAVSDCLGMPLKVAGGGLREGVIIELAAAG